MPPVQALRQPRLKFLYKINSGYDGFTPKRIDERRDARERLILGWSVYIDVVEKGSEVWVYFLGRHAFRPGVYVKGFVDEIDTAARRVYLRVREYSATTPIADAETNRQVADAVAQRFRQVFFLPEALLPAVDVCSAQTCATRHCERCRRWQSIPLIEPDDLRRPSRIPNIIDDFVPAFWVEPSRCFLYYAGQPVAPAVRAGSQMFYGFKTGEVRYAYPLARGIYDSLATRGNLHFDCVVPVPLSPDKVAARELNRTAALATELADLLATRLVHALSLREPISKRRLRNDGWSAGAFEQRYLNLLDVSPRIREFKRVLLVDDVCDHGSTLRCCAMKLQADQPDMEIVAAAAGQMIIKEAVADRTRLIVAP